MEACEERAARSRQLGSAANWAEKSHSEHIEREDEAAEESEEK